MGEPVRVGGGCTSNCALQFAGRGIVIQTIVIAVALQLCGRLREMEFNLSYHDTKRFLFARVERNWVGFG